MSNEGEITGLWTHGRLAKTIFAALEEAGVDTENLTAKDLAPLDHFHSGGAGVTRRAFAKMDLSPEMHLLDIGSGVGGPARMAASEYGCHVTGIDLTPEFCEVAAMLTEKTGLSDLVSFQQGNALDLPFADAGFDGAYTQNVSMNIPDKAAFYGEASRVIKPGGLFSAVEYVEGPNGPPLFPVPWALTPEHSHLASMEDTRAFLEAAGFEVLEYNDTTPIRLEHYEGLRQKMAAEGPPVLTTKLLMGENADERARNSSRNVEEGRIVPIEVLCRRH